MSNPSQDFCTCGPTCTCSPCDCRQEAACCASAPSSGRDPGCACGC